MVRRGSPVGAKVTSLQPGDRVVGECVLAPNTWFGFDYPGAGAQYFRAPAHLLHKLPSTLNFHQGALIEPFTIAYKGIRAVGGYAGRVLNIGICAEPTIAAPLGLIQAKDLTVYGTTGSSGVWPAALTFLQRHRIQLDDVITDTYPLQDAAAAVDATNDPANVKVHIVMDQTG